MLAGTNIEDLAAAAGGGKRQIKLTTAVVHDLKHDVRFLQKQADMKQFAQQTQKGNAKAHMHSARERKKIRRALRKMNQVLPRRVQTAPARRRTPPHSLTCVGGVHGDVVVCAAVVGGGCWQKEAEADMKKEEEAEQTASAEARAATAEASDVPQRSLFAIVRAPPPRALAMLALPRPRRGLR